MELTEAACSWKASYAVRTSLKGLGVHLAIDDFRRATHVYLKRFTVGAVKVDRSFVDSLGTDPRLCAGQLDHRRSQLLTLEVTAEE